MLPFDHFVETPRPELTLDDIALLFLRGNLRPEAELWGHRGRTTVWNVLAGSTEQLSSGWTVNRCERRAASFRWRIARPANSRVTWLSEPCTLDQLRDMTQVGTALPTTYVILDISNSSYIPLGWLMELPIPLAPSSVTLPARSDGRDLLLAVGQGLVIGLGIAATALAAFKLAQAAFDEDFGDGEFPRSVREELIDKHVAMHGWYCPRCSSNVPPGTLTVDHVVAMRNNGRTSRMNAQVICTSCNSSKGARNTPWDYVRGRAA